MRSSLVTRFILAGFLLAVLLGVVCLETLRSVNEASAIEGRRHMLMDMAATLESGPVTATIHELKTREGRRGQPPGLWVFSGHGQVLAKSVDDSPAVPFEAMEKPQGVHDFTIQYRPFLILPQSLLLRLDSPEPTYLLVEMRRPHTALVAEWVQFAFFLFVLAISTLSAVSLIFIYIGRKSKEARAVLARLEKGDLKARFEISRFDGIGSLMFDFNRMAGEIERLVRRVQETESARKHLLEELSHDLRTPLTSLRNSIEALVAHGEEMTSEQRGEFLRMSEAELKYFIHLIDDLFFVADLGEPRYKMTTENIDLVQLLGLEIRKRQAQQAQAGFKNLSWEFDNFGRKSQDAQILGDPVLIRRLFVNALDNAARHSRSAVQVHGEIGDESVIIYIDDDGPGISDESIELFGQRRRQRIAAASSGQDISLGLGSVIMRTLLELHGGALQIQRRINRSGEGIGSRLTLILPKK